MESRQCALYSSAMILSRDRCGTQLNVGASFSNWPLQEYDKDTCAFHDFLGAPNCIQRVNYHSVRFWI